MRKFAKPLSILIFILGTALAVNYARVANARETTAILSPISNSVNIFSLFNEHKQPKKIIYGYLPYWIMGQAEYLQLDKLTDIAYFGIYINADGSFKETLDDGTEEPGYANWKRSESLARLIEDSKKSGVRVSLTVISHEDEASDRFLDCKDCWPVLALNIKKELKRHGLKDVNLNFEYAEYTDVEKAKQYTEFVKFLHNDLDKTYGDSFLVVSTFADSLVKPRVTEIGELAKVTDGLFIMAYDFHRPSSDNAGPVSPIGGIGVHAEYDIKTMIKDYLTVAPPNKLIMGVPYYGYNWVVTSSNAYAIRIEGRDDIGYSQSQTYAGIMDTILRVRPLLKWDALGQTPYFSYVSAESGSTREVYFDNEQSLRAKYQLINENNLKGVGIWALGYDEGYAELWNLLYDEFIE